jgi:hypothetical protein
MATISLRSMIDVPPPPPRLPRFRRLTETDDFEHFLVELDPNKAGEVRLDDSEELPRIKSRLRRAAARLERDIRIWDSEGKVYFALSDAV